MRGIAVVGDLIAHAGQKPERPAVAQFGVEFTLQHVKHVAAIAPVVREIAGRIFDMPHPEIADVEGAPNRLPGLAGIDRGWNSGPIGHGERQRGDFHTGCSSEGGTRKPAVIVCDTVPTRSNSTAAAIVLRRFAKVNGLAPTATTNVE